MTNYQNATELSSLTLGKATDYVSQYSPELLQPVPRSLNRDGLNIHADNLPFLGEDVWYGYEISWLNAKGKPQVAVGEFKFPATSPNIVESKSFKLYLNSFNQSRFDSWDEVTALMVKDLSKTAGKQAQVTLFPVDSCPALELKAPAHEHTCIDDIDIEVDNYDLNLEVLKNASKANSDINSGKGASKTTEHLVSHLLKSNCLITNQPDWASVFISYTGEAIDHQALLTYLVSFRQHNEFHEQCVERIFSDLQSHFKLESLSVFARYTRRGGLDINPFRSTETSQAPAHRTLRQ